MAARCYMTDDNWTDRDLSAATNARGADLLERMTILPVDPGIDEAFGTAKRVPETEPAPAPRGSATVAQNRTRERTPTVLVVISGRSLVYTDELERSVPRPTRIYQWRK